MSWHDFGTDPAHAASAIVCAGLALALALLSLAAGFAWGRASAPGCPVERMRESGGARWCLLGQAAGEAGR